MKKKLELADDIYKRINNTTLEEKITSIIKDSNGVEKKKIKMINKNNNGNLAVYAFIKYN